MSYYAVLDGVVPGIYESWDDCRQQVNGYSRAVFRKFSNYSDAYHCLYHNRIIVYVDGSCINNGRSYARAGYGIYFENPELQGLNISEPLTGNEQTNNRAELTAIIRAIQLAPDDNRVLVICLDSQYSMNTVARWICKWQGNGWRNVKGLPVANVDLIMALDDELSSRALRPQPRYVSAHLGWRGNEIADASAKEAARR
ncbi:hypothetical protein NDA16_004036 [Ustilago loliicola]|nr:hypothetical protein NDA16_004036 [Ustilago loliicola]